MCEMQHFLVYRSALNFCVVLGNSS